MDRALRDDALTLAPHALSAWLGYTHRMERDLEKVGLSISRYAALSVLAEKGKIHMSTLGRELGVTMGAGTNLTDRMIESGLVQRARDTEDRRVVWVEITGKGRKALKGAEDVAADYLASRLAALDGAERTALITVCRKLAIETTPALPRK